MKIGQQSLLGYLPAQVIKSVLDKTLTTETKYPLGIPVETVSLFADISGFTKLSEKFSKKGRAGPECLAFCLNRYMEELINMIAKNGGDIFKFAGDALLVIWPKSSNSNLVESCRRAMQCAIAIQNKLHSLDMGSGNKLSVKIGIGVGECKIFFVGGKFKRAEYLIVGPAMKQACSSECHITEGGQIVVSEKVYDLIKDYFDFTKTEQDLEHPDTNDMDYYRYNNHLDKDKDKEKTKLQVKAEASLMRTNFDVEQIGNCMSILRTFVPAAITCYLDIEKESWCKELRLLTIMFIKLSLDLKDTETAQGQTKIQNVVFKVQQCVYRTRGSLNKFLMDDKGSVLLICWGLPPFSTHDDPVRAVMSAIDIVNELKANFGVKALIGITTGCVFSGVCGGSGARREYSLLGEIVNLSARFMQTAIMIYEVEKNKAENKNQLDKLSIFLCENTKKLIQNKIFCEFRVKKLLKGFSEAFDHYSPIKEDPHSSEKITIESIFTLIKTHRNNKHSEKEINVESESKSIKLIGFIKERETFMAKFKQSQTQKGQLLLISGIIGSGKSFFIRSQLARILKDINGEHLSKILFVSNQTPITHTIPMNAFNDAMKKIFSELKQIHLLAQKRELIEVQPGFIVEGTPLFKLIAKTDNYQNMRYIEEIIGQSFSDQYFIVPNQDKNCMTPIKELDDLRDPFFEKRDHEQVKIFLAKFFVELILMYKSYITKDLPLLFIVEDCQVIDCLSIEFINQINDAMDQEQLKNLFMVCTFQTLICGLKDSEKAKYSKLNTCFEEIFTPESTIMLSQMMEANDITELLSMSITSVLRRRQSTSAMSQGEGGGVNANPEPASKTIEILIENIEEDVIQTILPLSFKGNPLFLIEITQSLLNQQLLIMKKSTIALSDELKKMPFKDYTGLHIPFIIEKVIGNIIDALKCTEIIILKHASAIGNIFDIDKLLEIISFPSITFEDLVEMIKNFESMGLIEILYDINPKHIVAMFSIPFLREVLYQRMLVEQNYEIHGLLARKMQFSKFSYLPKEIEQKILRRHLECAERTIFTYLQDDDTSKGRTQNEIVLSNQKALVTRDIFEKLKIIDLKLKSSYYSVTKGIAPLLLASSLWKKDDRGNKYEERYCIITNQKFCYYYQNSDYTMNKEPLASFFLKNIYQITLLGNEEKSSSNNNYYSMEIKVSAWFKKDIAHDDRTFVFAFDTKDELNKWEISLNFLRIKTMYDEFTSSFGMIQLPLKDNSRYEKKKIKRKLNIKLRDGKHTLSSIAQSKTKLAFNRKKTITNIGNTGTADHSTAEEENNNLTSLNENVNSIFNYGIGLFFGILQERVKHYYSSLLLKNCPEHMKTCKKNNVDFSES